MSGARKALFGASIVMFVISVLHLGLVMQEVTLPRAPKGNRKIQIILSAFQFITGDLILIWRVWHIWERNYWIAAVPLAVMIAAAGLTFNLAAQNRSSLFFVVTPAALVVANTVMCTSLLAGRIWYMNRQLRKVMHTAAAGAPNYTGVMGLLIESGALYTLTMIITLILDSVGSIALPILLDLEIPLIGILPTMIVILVHFNMVPGSTTKDRYTASVSSRWQSRTNPTSTAFSQTVIISDDTGAPRSMVIPAFDGHQKALEQGKRRTDDGGSWGDV